jgi:hypothetical protein
MLVPLREVHHLYTLGILIKAPETTTRKPTKCSLRVCVILLKFPALADSSLSPPRYLSPVCFQVVRCHYLMPSQPCVPVFPQIVLQPIQVLRLAKSQFKLMMNVYHSISIQCRFLGCRSRPPKYPVPFEKLELFDNQLSSFQRTSSPALLAPHLRKGEHTHELKS